jgi:hypothetical protein
MKKILLLILLLIILIGLLFRGIPQSQGMGLGNCDDSHDVKTDGESLVTDPNKIWVKAIIKAGSQNQGDACFTFTQDGNDGCYAVSGLGTDTAHATKIGEGRDCKDISHVEWFSENHSSSPTPEPSADPSPEVSPTPEVTPSPIIEVTTDPSPIVTPSPEVLVSPSPTPVTQKEVEKEVQKMIEEVKKEDPQLLGKVSFK